MFMVVQCTFSSMNLNHIFRFLSHTNEKLTKCACDERRCMHDNPSHVTSLRLNVNQNVVDMSSFSKTTKKQSNARKIEISNRVFVVVTRFQGKTWYHIRESAKDKCVSLMKDELAALFLKKTT